MPDGRADGEISADPKPSTGTGPIRASRSGPGWRPGLRAVHRDLGYVAVGLTVVYAASGLAVNHLTDWDPNFTNYRQVRQIGTGLPAEPNAAAAESLRRLGVKGTPSEVFAAAPDQLEMRVGEKKITVNPQNGRVVEQGRQSRFFVRLANWLHLNRGKRAWTLIADLYAVGLLVLATTGMFMLPGKKGLRGRGALLVAAGVAVPVLYVVLSGGPGGR